MNTDSTSPDPSPEQLAAFLDGELDPAARSRVETWLKGRPEAAAEIDGQRRVARLWAEHAPAEPTPDAWAATLARIQARLPAPSRPAYGRRRTLWLGAGLAAAVVAAAVLGRLFLVGGVRDAIHPDKIHPPSAIDPDATAKTGPADDEPILLASQDDVSVMNVEAYKDDDQVPQIGEGEVPMIVAPLVARAGREP